MFQRLLFLFILFLPSLSQSNPVYLKEISDLILTNQELKNYCHPALERQCFWYDKIYLIGYSSKKIYYLKDISKNDNSATTIYQIFSQNQTDRPSLIQNYVYESDRFSGVKDFYISDIDVFWKYEKESINKILKSKKVQANRQKINFDIKPADGEKIDKKIIDFMSSYQCKNCVLPIKSRTVLGFMKINEYSFAILGFLEEGIEAGPPVIHVDFLGL
jgi:hypothetical protein